jgi:hypothetical protein
MIYPRKMFVTFSRGRIRPSATLSRRNSARSVSWSNVVDWPSLVVDLVPVAKRASMSAMRCLRSLLIPLILRVMSGSGETLFLRDMWKLHFLRAEGDQSNFGKSEITLLPSDITWQ